MGNVIQTDPPGKRRYKILRLLSTLMMQSNFRSMNEVDTRDKTAFVYLSLMEIEKTIDETVRPWEKREYWVKADAFRKEWAWVKDICDILLINFNTNNWQSMDQETKALKEKLSMIKPLKRIDHQDFWKGAYQTLSEKILKK